MNAAIERHVLVLNRLWQAVNVCTVDRALSLLFTGHAQVVHEDGGDFSTFNFSQWCDFSNAADFDAQEDAVRSISIRIRIPRIILLLFFDRMPNKEVKFTRQNVFERDKNTCQYCGHKFDRKDLNLDHVVPRQHGGLTAWTNVVCSCVPCNSRKGNRTPEEAGLRLIRKPKKPRWRPFLEVQFAKSHDHSWRHFLDLAYWNVELGEDSA
jgi:5-methylcytosine-specific restriction endonuclease McrA